MATYKSTGYQVPPEERSISRMPGRAGRVINSQMNISLPFEMHERLRQIAWEHRLPLSHLCRELLEEGLRGHKEYGEGQSVEASEKEHEAGSKTT